MKTKMILMAVVVAAMASFAAAAFNWNEVRQQRQMMPNRPAWQQDFDSREGWQPGAAGRFWGYNAPRMQQPYAMRQYPQQGRRGQFEGRGFGEGQPQTRGDRGGFNPQMRQRFGQDCPFGSCPYRSEAMREPYQSRQNFPDAQKMRQMYQRRAFGEQSDKASRGTKDGEYAPNRQKNRQRTDDAESPPKQQTDRTARRARGGEQRQEAAPSSDELKTQLRQAVVQKDYDKAQRILGRLKEIDK